MALPPDTWVMLRTYLCRMREARSIRSNLKRRMTATEHNHHRAQYEKGSVLYSMSCHAKGGQHARVFGHATLKARSRTANQFDALD